MRIALALLLTVITLPGITRTLEWDDLVPAGWEPNEVYDRIVVEVYGDKPLENLDDEDELANKLMDGIDRAWREAPLKTELDNTPARIPGYVVPLEGDNEHIREFLLVPYFGACVHLPPPPRNQIVLVKMQNKGIPIDLSMNAVWITGNLKVTSSDTEYGMAGYTLEGQHSKPFNDNQNKIP